jgi:hypothetical protein
MPATTDSWLYDVQTEIASRLRGDELLGSLTIVSEATADPTAEVSRAVGLDGSGTAKGVCLVILQPIGTPESSDLPYPVLRARLAIRVLEEPVLNQTGQRALYWARRVSRVLWQYVPTRLSSPLVPESPNIVPADDPYASVAYDILFECREAREATASKCSMPTIAATGSALPHTITLATATSGAAIHYTTDGTYPRNGNGTLYSVPFVVSSACELRAVATKSGLIASDCAAVGIS